MSTREPPAGRNLEQERTLSENALMDKAYDFEAKFMAVHSLQSLAERHPEIININTLSTLEKVLLDSEFKHQTQAYFMYKEVANTLCSVVIHSANLSGKALETLKKLLGYTNGHPHRATAEALGALPFSIIGPKIKSRLPKHIPCVSWEAFFKSAGNGFSEDVQFIGRSLVTKRAVDGRLLVIKLVRSNESFENLFMETQWMKVIEASNHCFPVRFNVPEPLQVKGSFLFSLENLPQDVPRNLEIHYKKYAICFRVDQDYFFYPNDIRPENQLDFKAFEDVILRNAWLLGRLASDGIVHSAPVPLFHNRVQQGRRRDQGLYEWPRAGRLDRWLESCLYPNLGVTGVRDFEHFFSFNGKSKALYRYMGVHLMSLLLVCGSYFRNRDPGRVGFDSNGNSVDARDLFDRNFLKNIIEKTFYSYYCGFTSRKYSGEIPIDLDFLTVRIIEEMGVDRHMEEILRIGDQNQMMESEFRDFLRQRGFSRHKIKSIRKGEKEIVFFSGPHLGEFNRQISLPELIEAVGTMASLCIAGRYCANSDAV